MKHEITREEESKRILNFCFNTKSSHFLNFDSFGFLNYLIETNLFNYIIFQKEETKERGEHWQGYAELKKQKYLRQMRAIFGFVEPRIKTKEQAINYCKKERSRIEDVYYEWGKKRRARNTRKETEGVIKDREKNEH